MLSFRMTGVNYGRNFSNICEALTRTWIANAGEQNFVIEINEWCGIYNYCYTKVSTEFSVFQFPCIITCVT